MSIIVENGNVCRRNGVDVCRGNAKNTHRHCLLQIGPGYNEKTRQVKKPVSRPVEQVHLLRGLGAKSLWYHVLANRQTGLVEGGCKVPLVPRLSKQTNRQSRLAAPLVLKDMCSTGKNIRWWFEIPDDSHGWTVWISGPNTGLKVWYLGHSKAAVYHHLVKGHAIKNMR